jgi:hypothetical protein
MMEHAYEVTTTRPVKTEEVSATRESVWPKTHPVAFSTINFESYHKSTRLIFGADENCNSERPKTVENYPNSTTILEFRLLDRSRTSAVFEGKAGSKTPVCL